MRFNIYASSGHLGGTDAMPTGDEARFITTDGDLEVWQPLTWEGAVKLGGYGGVRAYWDTAAVSGHPSWFSMYADEGPLYIFIDKSNPLKKYQYHPATATFANIKDHVWTKDQVDEFFAEHPVAADAIGYGYSQTLMSDEQAEDMPYENFVDDIPYDDYGDDVEACGDINCATKYDAGMCNIGASGDYDNGNYTEYAVEIYVSDANATYGDYFLQQLDIYNTPEEAYTYCENNPLTEPDEFYVIRYITYANGEEIETGRYDELK